MSTASWGYPRGPSSARPWPARSHLAPCPDRSPGPGLSGQPSGTARAPLHGVAGPAAWGNPRFLLTTAALPSPSPAPVARAAKGASHGPDLPGRPHPSRQDRGRPGLLRELQAGRKAGYQRPEQRIEILKQAWYLAPPPQETSSSRTWKAPTSPRRSRCSPDLKTSSTSGSSNA